MRFIQLIPIVLAAATAAAQTTTLPASATGINGNTTNLFPWGSNAASFPGLRIQCLYDSSHFTAAPVPITAPILITNVRWRANDVATTTSWTGGTYSNAKLGLGTAAVDHASATTNTATNIGPDYQIVHNGPVTVIGGSGLGVGVPGPIAVDLALNPPFFYDPNAGDLVVDTDFLTGAWTGGTLPGMDVHSTNVLARRVYCSSYYPLANGVDSAAPVLEIAYTPAPAGTPASNALIGAGCNRVDDLSFYELFATSAAFDLANSGITLLRSENGYLALPGAVAFVPPTATAQVLTLADNATSLVTLSQPLPYGRSATTTTLAVGSNGFIQAAAGTVTTGTPAAATMLNSLRAFWGVCWHDMNPAIPGSGQVKFEELGGVAYITWDGVWDNAGTSVADANTMQAQFDLATGTVHYVYGTMSPGGNARLVGFSDAGGSVNAGSIDISALLPATFQAAGFRLAPLTLGPTSRPILGTNWDLFTSEIPATGVIGLDVFGVADPGINDLTFLGMPNCGIRASLDLLNAWLPAGSSHSYSLPLPVNPALVNLHVYTTSVMFQPGANPFGAISSNAVDGKIGDV